MSRKQPSVWYPACKYYLALKLPSFPSSPSDSPAHPLHVRRYQPKAPLGSTRPPTLRRPRPRCSSRRSPAVQQLLQLLIEHIVQPVVCLWCRKTLAFGLECVSDDDDHSADTALEHRAPDEVDPARKHAGVASQPAAVLAPSLDVERLSSGRGSSTFFSRTSAPAFTRRTCLSQRLAGPSRRSRRRGPGRLARGHPPRSAVALSPPCACC